MHRIFSYFLTISWHRKFGSKFQISSYSLVKIYNQISWARKVVGNLEANSMFTRGPMHSHVEQSGNTKAISGFPINLLTKEHLVVNSDNALWGNLEFTTRFPVPVNCQKIQKYPMHFLPNFLAKEICSPTL